MDKQVVIYTYNGTLFHFKKKRNSYATNSYATIGKKLEETYVR